MERIGTPSVRLLELQLNQPQSDNGFKGKGKRQKILKQKQKREYNMSVGKTTITVKATQSTNAGKHIAQVEEEVRNRKRVKRSVRQLPGGIATKAMKLLEIVADAVALEKQ